MRCLENANNAGMPIVPLATSQQDNYVRVQLFAIERQTRSAAPLASQLSDIGAATAPPAVTTAGGSAAEAGVGTDAATPKTGSTLPIPDATSTSVAPEPTRGTTPVRDVQDVTAANSPAPANSTTTTYYLRHQELARFTCVTGSSQIPSVGEWIEIDGTTFTAVDVPGPPPADANTGALANRWVVVRIDQNGCVVGVGPGAPGAFIGGSCWTSVLAGRLRP
jgi:hypothetical protein